jgi:TonB family protein
MRPFLRVRSLARGRKTFSCLRLLFYAAVCTANIASPAKAGVKITYANGPQVAAMFLKFGRIEYPYEARRSRLTGSGIFRVYIHPDGKVKTVGVVRSTGHPELDLAAAAGLYHCLAKPGGRREVDMPVTFTMSRP